MPLNFTALAAALATFLGIWLGHVAVRRLEARAANLALPVGACIALGLALEVVSLLAVSNALSAALGIFGLTVLWDALEFHRQEARVKRGRAPANPANPRHARIMAEHPSATTINWLKRDPRGKAYSGEELAAIRAGEGQQ